MADLDVLQLHNFGADSPREFYCNTFQEHIRTFHKDITIPHKHNFYLTVLFTHGMGRHEIDFEEYPIYPGAIFMLNPGQTHHWELSEDADGYIFFHSRDFYDSYFSQHSVNEFPFFSSLMNASGLKIPKASSPLLWQLFGELYEKTRSKTNNAPSIARGIIQLIYLYLDQAYREQGMVSPSHPGGYSRHMQEFEKLIERNFISEKQVSQYADWLNITPRHLNRVSQSAVGKSPISLITARAMLEAKRMLYYTDKPIGEIATLLGFDDLAYFSRLFKKHCGISPRHFHQSFKRNN
ncbi:AraC family transcriptional regulator [Echinicola pacifica]|nr:helix-turn-helix domain-containing protein [Echinicola pacifica]